MSDDRDELSNLVVDLCKFVALTEKGFRGFDYFSILPANEFFEDIDVNLNFKVELDHGFFKFLVLFEVLEIFSECFFEYFRPVFAQG